MRVAPSRAGFCPCQEEALTYTLVATAAGRPTITTTGNASECELARGLYLALGMRVFVTGIRK